MEIQVRKLRDTLALLEPVIPRKSGVKATQCFLLKDGKAIATNLDIWAELEMEDAREPVLLNKDVLDYLKVIPGDTVALISQDGSIVTVSCGSSRSTFDTEIQPDEYPIAGNHWPIPNIQMDGDRLVEALTMAAPYTAIEDTRPVLQAVCLDLDIEKYTAAASDGFRLIYKQVQSKCGENLRALINRDTVGIMAHFWKKVPKGVNIAADALLSDLALSKRLMEVGFSSECMLAKWGNLTLLVKLVQGTFPNYAQLIPTNPQTITFFAPDFYMALERVSQVAAKGSGIVRLEWSLDRMKASAMGDGRIAETELPVINIIGETAKNRIAFNIKYLLSYFKDRQGVIEMAIADTSSPGLFLDGKCTVVMMPMMAQRGDEPPKQPAPQVEPSTDAVEESIPASEVVDEAEDVKKSKTHRKKRGQKQPVTN